MPYPKANRGRIISRAEARMKQVKPIPQTDSPTMQRMWTEQGGPGAVPKLKANKLGTAVPPPKPRPNRVS